MGTNYIAPIWRMPRNANKDKLSNYSIKFDAGSSDEIVTTFLGTGQTEISISAWINLDSIGSAQTIFGTVWASSTALTFDVDDTGKLRLFFRSGGNPSPGLLLANTVLSASTWYHAAVTLTPNGSNMDCTFYLNGVIDNTTGAPQAYGQGDTAIASSGTGYNIGSTALYLGASYNFFNGKIGQLSVFDYVLSSTQITYLYNLNNPMAITGAEPVAYWPLGDNSNPTANAGYPNISVGADSVFDFDSTSPGDYINIGVPNFLSATSTFTSSLWFNTDDVNSQTTLWMVGSSASQLWGLSKFQDDLIIYGGSSTKYYRKNTLFNINTWYNLIVVYDGSQSNANRYKAYLNGVLLTSPTIYGTIDTTTPTFTTDLNIGRIDYAAASYFNGKISNVQIWDTPLSGPEVETLYNNGQPLIKGTQPQAANLKAWYKLNQSSNWEADSAGNWQIPDATSAFPQSFKFIQANNDAIDTGSINLGTENSISFWFNFNDAGTTQTIIGSSGTSHYIIQFGGNYIAIRPDGGSDVFYSPYFTLIRPPYKTQGVWGHYLITRNGNTIRLFINGDEKAVSGTGTGMGSTIINRIGTSGGASGGAYANGEISNVAFWNSDQSSEKDNIYNDGTPATSYTNTPQYWYKLDNTSVWNPAPANYWTFPNAGEQDNSGIFNFSN